MRVNSYDIIIMRRKYREPCRRNLTGLLLLRSNKVLVTVKIYDFGNRRGSYTQKGGATVPRKPKKPCAYSGCPNLTDDKYCDEHKHLGLQDNIDYNRYRRDPDSNKRYGRAWKRIRDRYVSTHPLCERCKAEGRLTPVEEVHHIIPLNQGGSNKEDNLMSLCHNCHMKIHGEMKTNDR